MMNRTTQAASTIMAAARAVMTAAAKGKSGSDLVAAIAAWPAAAAAFAKAIATPDLTRIPPGNGPARQLRNAPAVTTPSAAAASRMPQAVPPKNKSPAAGAAPAAALTEAQVQAAFASLTPAQQAAILATAAPST